MKTSDEHGKRLERVKKYIKAKTGKKVNSGENAGHVGYRLLQQQTKDRRGTRSINQYLDDYAETMEKTIREKSGQNNQQGTYVEHPLVKRFRWRVGESATDIVRAVGDCALFAEKNDPDDWIDSCKAALKMQSLQWFVEHHPQSVAYLEAAARAETK